MKIFLLKNLSSIISVNRIVLLSFLILLSCKSDKYYQKTEQQEVDGFFEDFVNIKKKDYNFNEIAYINYGDSLALKYWIEDSRVDTAYLKKYINLKRTVENSIIHKRPAVFNHYKDFDFEDFNKYKRKNPYSNFNEYFSKNFKESELMSINFLVFNKQKDRALIYYGINHGVVEVYSKKNDKWFLLKEISRTAM